MVFDKTDKGREEIATRKYQLAPRLRTLLVLVDGKQSVGELLKKVAGIGLTEDSIASLLNDGYIQPVPASDAAEQILSGGPTQFQAIYQFYTGTIKSTIGLRGYALQLMVEKATSVDDFRELRQSYLDAVLKAKGKDTARSRRRQLDQLLYLGENPMPATTIIELDAASNQ